MIAGANDLEALAAAALERGTEAAAELELASWLSANPAEPRILQWRALLLRALDRRGEAITLLQRAEALDPQDGGIAHNLAQITHEAGQAASALFGQALRLNPTSPAIRLGLTSARYAEGDGEAALAELEAVLTSHPGWYEGHRQFAQLATLMDHSERRLDSLRAAIRRFPDAADPVYVAAELQMSAGDHAGALALVEPALSQLSADPLLLQVKAAALDELGDLTQARQLFDQLGPAQEIALSERRIRHFLRGGDPALALREAEPWLASTSAPIVWPYVALAWRALGDRHASWLEEQDGLVRTVDLATAADFAGLAERLRTIHQRSGRFLDQSVRRGTQSDGALFARIEPEIVAVRQLVSAAISAHIAALPAPDERHPQLAVRRDQAPRFAGSWSVRLHGEGHHTAHHHPQGWFSGVLYVTVPAQLRRPAGYLALGSSPPELGLGLMPRSYVEPAAGRLAIFPSTLWHATEPFREGERMTISFDVARPFEET